MNLRFPSIRYLLDLGVSPKVIFFRASLKYSIFSGEVTEICEALHARKNLPYCVVSPKE